jgi:hypothetical protein
MSVFRGVALSRSQDTLTVANGDTDDRLSLALSLNVSLIIPLIVSSAPIGVRVQ